MFPSKRRITLACSPLIVCYAEGLLSIQYVYGFNLTDDELPVETAGGYKYKEIGLDKDDPSIHLAVQVSLCQVLSSYISSVSTLIILKS